MEFSYDVLVLILRTELKDLRRNRYLGSTIKSISRRCCSIIGDSISQPMGIEDYHQVLAQEAEVSQPEALKYELAAWFLASCSESHHLRLAIEQLTDYLLLPDHTP